MAIKLVRIAEKHIPQAGRIIFEAFKGISDAHAFPLDIPSVEVATMLTGSLITRPDFYGVAAIDQSAPETVLGVNFAQLSDPVSGIGPICVDPHCQARGVGKMLMQHIVEWSLKNHGPMVRLLQDSFNMTSLSLYTSLGYTAQEPIVLMSVAPAAQPDATVRALALSDLEAADALCKKIYKVSRKNELAAMIQHGANFHCIPQGRFVNGQLVASLIPGFFGFGVAASNEHLLDTLQQAARVSPPPLHRVLIPARNGELFRAALRRGFKSIKLLTLMSIGPYAAPEGAWHPAIAY